MVQLPKNMPRTVLIAAVLAAVAVLGGYMVFKPTHAGPTGLKIIPVTVNSNTLRAEVADTPEAITQGLGGRRSLPADHAMLFVFDSDGTYCFWMKDMHFPIDVVWLNKDKKVVSVKQRVQPSSYPDQFCPDSDARYVIEMNAGQASNLGITTGTAAAFQMQ
jgi:uncharacterized membrane protein (UPF0127 family)